MLMEKILEQVEEASIAQNEDFVPIDRNLLITLRIEAQKLKDYRNVNKITHDRLVKLLTTLERTIREVMNEDGTLNLPISEGEDESDETLKELVDDRLCRAADAACISLTVMTSPKMPKQILLEDTIERSISLCKEFCQSILFPSFDLSLKNAATTPAKATKGIL
jgi:hypothetical protein